MPVEFTHVVGSFRAPVTLDSGTTWLPLEGTADIHSATPLVTRGGSIVPPSRVSCDVQGGVLKYWGRDGVDVLSGAAYDVYLKLRDSTGQGVYVAPIHFEAVAGETVDLARPRGAVPPAPPSWSLSPRGDGIATLGADKITDNGTGIITVQIGA